MRVHHGLGEGGMKFLDVWKCRYRTQVGLPRFLSCKEKKRTVDAEQARSPDLPPDIPPLRSLTVFYNNSCDAENQHNRGYNMTSQGYLYSNRKLFRMVSDAGREIMRVYSWGNLFSTHTVRPCHTVAASERSIDLLMKRKARVP